MSASIPDELVIEGIARACAAWIDRQPELVERLLTRMAELHHELLTPEQAAEILGISVATLRKNFRQYGIQKSTALGAANPRFFRSQILAAMNAEGKLIRGRSARPEAPRPTLASVARPFHRRHAPTLPRPETADRRPEMHARAT